MVKVLFIAGWQRSGTTVAGNVLGSAPGAAHIGELHYLWMKEHPAGFECGCGELIFECPESEIEEMTELVRYEMEHAWELKVPLVVSIGHGTSWEDAKD